jgi:hypothetical protein
MSNNHCLPWSTAEKQWLMKMFIKHGTSKAVWEKVIHPLVERQKEKRQACSRLETMHLSNLNKFASRMGLQNKIRPGEPDMKEAYQKVMSFPNKAVVGFKLPGHSVNSSMSVLVDEAKDYLETNDLFIFLMTTFQVDLLKSLGSVVSSDGTHAVFSYNNVKLIVVLVSSSVRDPNVKERGFPVGIAITTSEREDIHSAIIAHIRSAVGSQWEPKLLMTDMAFSAINAWKKFFPSIKWLWCKFHVWQAWIKKLRHANRPDGMTKDQWGIMKGKLIREVKELISPEAEPNMSKAQFNERCTAVSNILWSVGLTEIAETWDMYVSNQDKWSPPSRNECVSAIFGDIRGIPMLIKSNNALERFFGVLKHIILEGMSISTICAFLDVWRIYQSRIYINAVEARLFSYLDSVNVQETNAFNSEDNQVLPRLDTEDEDDDENERPEAEDNCDFERFCQQRNIELANRKNKEQSKAITAVESVASCIDQFRNFNLNDVSCDSADLQAITRLANSLCLMMNRVLEKEQCYTVGLGNHARAAFVKQANNYGAAQFKPTMPSIIDNTTLDVNRPSINNENTSADSPDVLRVQLPSGTMIPPISDRSESLNVQSLYKEKKKKKTCMDRTPEWMLAQNKPFLVYADEILKDEKTMSRIAEAKKLAATSGLPLLRIALAWNTINRIRAIAYDLYFKRFDVRPSWSKATLISNLLQHILGNSAMFPENVANSIADLGVAHTQSDDLEVGEIIFLCQNGISSSGEVCVIGYNCLSGWISRDSKLVFLKSISLQNIHWGKLVQRSKNLTIAA